MPTQIYPADDLELPATQSPRRHSGALAACTLCIAILATPAWGWDTTTINYHPNVVGSALSEQLKALREAPGGAGSGSWRLSIHEVNARKGTSYSDFEAWAAVDRADPAARAIGELIASGIIGPPSGGQ